MATVNAPITLTIPAGERQLSDLAYQWRGASDPTQAAQLVQTYHQVVAQLQTLGWTGTGLAADAQLPDHLMPPFLQGR